MPLASYGVLKGTAVDRRLGSGQSPHYQIRVVDDDQDYRIAINVMSALEPSTSSSSSTSRSATPSSRGLVSWPPASTPWRTSPAAWLWTSYGRTSSTRAT
jgi:uncharacterized protein YukJ